MPAALFWGSGGEGMIKRNFQRGRRLGLQVRVPGGRSQSASAAAAHAMARGPGAKAS